MRVPHVNTHEKLASSLQFDLSGLFIEVQSGRTGRRYLVIPEWSSLPKSRQMPPTDDNVLEVVVYHTSRPAIISFADQLRAAGHIVHTPDLSDGEY